MSKLRLRLSISLDGFVAGPNQSIQDPLGVGGEGLHQWAFALEAFRSRHGKEGGEVNPSSAALDEAQAGIGATIMGRHMFGGHPGGWNRHTPPWGGWWGETPPFHHPVFVLTHHARDPLAMAGDTTFHFVTDGIGSALAQARAAASSLDVQLAGGAATANEYLAAGLVDQADISLVPILLGSGERLFAGVGDLHGLTLVKTVAAPDVVHLKLARG
jgi:dihydrofolate reductase